MVKFSAISIDIKLTGHNVVHRQLVRSDFPSNLSIKFMSEGIWSETQELDLWDLSARNNIRLNEFGLNFMAFLSSPQFLWNSSKLTSCSITFLLFIFVFIHWCCSRGPHGNNSYTFPPIESFHPFWFDWSSLSFSASRQLQLLRIAFYPVFVQLLKMNRSSFFRHFTSLYLLLFMFFFSTRSHICHFKRYVFCHHVEC